MKQQLRIGSNPITLSGTSFGRAYLLVQGVGASAIADTDFNLNYLRTQIEISQAGIKDSTAFNAVGPVTRAINELPYTTSSAILTGPSLPAFTWNTATNGQTLAGVYTTSGKTTSVFYVPLLEGGYSLKGDDYIRFNIDVLPTFLSSNVTAGSSVYLVTEEANGIVQTDVNIPVYEPITTDKQSPAFSYDAVSVCEFLNAVENNPNGSFEYTTDPLQSVDFRSQFVTEQFDIQTLYAKNLAENSNPLVNSHTIYSVEPSALWDVYIGLAINTTDVTIGSQFLYVSKVLTGSSLLNRAVAHEEKIIKTNLKMRGVVAPRKKY